MPVQKFYEQVIKAIYKNGKIEILQDTLFNRVYCLKDNTCMSVILHDGKYIKKDNVIVNSF